MRTELFFRSLALELDAVKNRVRYLIENAHWQTDGEWKESVVRQVLRRHLPASISVGRGFVVTASRSSHQVDVLLFDSTKPVLFQDGDLAFVTPDAVLGLIEVKSRSTVANFRDACVKLAEDMEFIRRHPNGRAFAGFFAFDSDGAGADAYLRAASDSATRWENRIDYVCLGRSHFLRYWHLKPPAENTFYEGWRSYDLPEMAPGYFIHGVVDAVSPQSVLSNKDVWFPQGGKEPACDGQAFGRWPSGRPTTE